MKNENKGNGLVIFIIVLVVLLVGGIVVYNLTAKPNETANNVETKETSVVAEVKDEDVFIEYNEEGLLKTVSIKNKSVLDTITSETKYTELKLRNELVSDNLAFIDIYAYGTQFDEDYLFVFDGNGKLVENFHLLTDKDNDNNKYKYAGNFKYEAKTLTFGTKLWLGEAEEGTGAAFDGKEISELSASELETFKNYADEVKYEYKLENGKFELVKKETSSQLKDNEFYKEYFK